HGRVLGRRGQLAVIVDDHDLALAEGLQGVERGEADPDVAGLVADRPDVVCGHADTPVLPPGGGGGKDVVWGVEAGRVPLLGLDAVVGHLEADRPILGTALLTGTARLQERRAGELGLGLGDLLLAALGEEGCGDAHEDHVLIPLDTVGTLTLEMGRVRRPEGPLFGGVAYLVAEALAVANPVGSHDAVGEAGDRVADVPVVVVGVVAAHRHVGGVLGAVGPQGAHPLQRASAAGHQAAPRALRASMRSDSEKASLPRDRWMRAMMSRSSSVISVSLGSMGRPGPTKRGAWARCA